MGYTISLWCKRKYLLKQNIITAYKRTENIGSDDAQENRKEENPAERQARKRERKGRDREGVSSRDKVRVNNNEVVVIQQGRRQKEVREAELHHAV